MTEEQLADEVLRRALDLQRVAAHDAREVTRLMDALAKDLRALLGEGWFSSPTRRNINRLIAEAEAIIKAGYTQFSNVVQVADLIAKITEQTVAVLRDAFPVVRSMSAERLASLTRLVLIEGAPSADWWAKQGDDLAFKFAAQVRQGVINGETQERIVQRIVGRGAEPGIMDVAKRNARTLVHSSVMAAANTARLETFRNNDDVFAGVRWLSTLDLRTCLVCASLDGAAWDFDGKPLYNTKPSFRTPPAHYACRCVLTGIPKRTALEEAFPGIGAKFDASRQRASRDGPVAGDMTFEAFLRRMSAADRRRYLGEGRAELFEAGKITLRDLISGAGREKPLSEL